MSGGSSAHFVPVAYIDYKIEEPPKEDPDGDEDVLEHVDFIQHAHFGHPHLIHLLHQLFFLPEVLDVLDLLPFQACDQGPVLTVLTPVNFLRQVPLPVLAMGDGGDGGDGDDEGGDGGGVHPVIMIKNLLIYSNILEFYQFKVFGNGNGDSGVETCTTTPPSPLPLPNTLN